MADPRYILDTGPLVAFVTHELAEQRNQFVAALADEVWFAHIAPGGQTERLAQTIARWSPISTP